MKNFLILLLIILCAYLFFFQEKERVVERVPEEIVKTVEVEVDRIVTKIDKEGFQHAVMSEVENVTRSRDSLADSAKAEIDSITKLLNIKDKQLKEYISYSTSLKDSLLIANSKTDTSFTYSDRYANIEFVFDTVKQPYFNFSYDANVNYATYWKRDWIFGKKKGYIDFWISDPRATINGVKRLKIEQPQKTFGLNINASSYYDYNLHSGIDGEVNIGRAKIGGGYFYDFGIKDWHPVFKVKYKLIDF